MQAVYHDANKALLSLDIFNADIKHTLKKTRF